MLARSASEGRRAPGLDESLRLRPGLTLIEVLLGLAIFMLALIAIGQLVDIGTSNALETMLQNDGTRLAQSKLAEVEAGVISPTSSTSGSFDNEEPWTWEMESAAGAAPNLYSVTVTAKHPLKGREFTVTMTQMILDPSAMGTAAPQQKPETETTTP